MSNEPLKVSVFDMETFYRSRLYEKLTNKGFNLLQKGIFAPTYGEIHNIQKSDRFLIFLHPLFVDVNSSRDFSNKLRGYEERGVFISACPRDYSEPAQAAGIGCVYLASTSYAEDIAMALINPRAPVSQSVIGWQLRIF